MVVCEREREGGGRVVGAAAREKERGERGEKKARVRGKGSRSEGQRGVERSGPCGARVVGTEDEGKGQ